MADTCPKCGSAMEDRPLTDANGNEVQLGTGGADGPLVSIVCPSCGYAELRAAKIADPLKGEEPTPEQVADFIEDFGVKVQGTGPGTYMQLESNFGRAGLRQMIAFHRMTEDLGDPSPGQLMAFFVLTALVADGVVLLYKIGGPVMQAGGFVASGGPYVIEHQAEAWMPLATLGFLAGLFAFFGHLLLAAKINRPNLMLLFWAALFGSQGAQFLYYGLGGPTDGPNVWSWIIMGVVFIGMALPAVVLQVPSLRLFKGSFGVVTAAGAVAGVAAAFYLFSAMTG